MKRNLSVFAVMVVVVLFFTPHNAGAQCPEDPNDLGICDTLHVETVNYDDAYEATGGYDSVRVAIYVTHDSNTFYSDPFGWVQDSICGFVVPLAFWHQPPGCADSVILPNWDDWNNIFCNPSDPRMPRSIFRDLVNEYAVDTVHNRMLDLSREDPQLAWSTVILDIESHSSDGDSGYGRLAIIPTGEENRKWWEGTRELLATLTFHVYMGEECDTTEIGLDSTFWPPAAWLFFTRYDAVNYIPRHLLPVCDTIWVPHPIARIVLPDDSASVYDTVRIILVDEGGGIETLTRALFEYSPNGTDWYYVDEDSDGTDRQASTWGPDTAYGDGWSGYWSTNSLSAGWYLVRGDFYTDSGLVSSDTICVWADPRPAIPTIFSPRFGAAVEDTAEIYFSIRDTTGIDSVIVYQEEAEEEYDRDVPKLKQKSTQCGPTAAASAIISRAKQEAYKKLKQTPEGEPLTDQKIVEELASLMWDEEHMTEKNRLIGGIRRYFRDRQLEDDFEFNDQFDEATGRPPRIKDYKDELEKEKEDVILLLWNGNEGEESKRHYVTGNSITDHEEKEENGTPFYYMDFMDPAHGTVWDNKWTDKGGENPSEVLYDPGGEPLDAKPWKVENMFTISPSKESPPDLITPRIAVCRFFPPIQGEYCCMFSTEQMLPGEVWFVEVQVYRTFDGHEVVYDDYITVVKFLPGDANGDGLVDIADIIYLIHYLFMGEPVPYPIEAGDCTCDGEVNTGDVIYLINYLFLGTSPPGC